MASAGPEAPSRERHRASRGKLYWTGLVGAGGFQQGGLLSIALLFLLRGFMDPTTGFTIRHRCLAGEELTCSSLALPSSASRITASLDKSRRLSSEEDEKDMHTTGASREVEAMTKSRARKSHGIIIHPTTIKMPARCRRPDHAHFD
ncbi:hypothetical protein CC78DRAFT_574169 [Lojkania enalia]|uniref:Uncharacterized protein n=1 Tax=Lojkania enalia TaxID=147567 RepID=A0A9P4TR68_9PLEO|nr:hypothetical protein CC78DRAFT_574169 [Didymosphaeria enalia]